MSLPVSYAMRVLADGRWAEVIALTFGRARIITRWPHDLGLLDGW